MTVVIEVMVKLDMMGVVPLAWFDLDLFPIKDMVGHCAVVVHQVVSGEPCVVEVGTVETRGARTWERWVLQFFLRSDGSFCMYRDTYIIMAVVIVVTILWVSDPVFEGAKALMRLGGSLFWGVQVTDLSKERGEFNSKGVRGGSHCDGTDGGNEVRGVL